MHQADALEDLLDNLAGFSVREGPSLSLPTANVLFEVDPAEVLHDNKEAGVGFDEL